MTLKAVLSTNLVLVGVELLNELDMIERFRADLGPDLRIEFGMVGNVVSGMAERSRILTLSKDRINLILHASRSTIEREYPEEEGFERLAHAAVRAIESTRMGDRVPRAFGYNMELRFDQQSGQPAFQYLGNRLFATQLFDKPGRNLVGGTGTLFSEDAAGRWTITVEPHLNNPDTSMIFLRINLHKQEQRFPDETEIRATLGEIQQEALDFVNLLEGVESS